MLTVQRKFIFMLLQLRIDFVGLFDRLSIQFFQPSIFTCRHEYAYFLSLEKSLNMQIKDKNFKQHCMGKGIDKNEINRII